jgi:hypothetical protein
MFAVGQKVWSHDRKRSGTVLECDGDRVFIEQENGAELELAAAALTATPPEAPTPAPKPRDGREPASSIGQAIPNRTLTARDITPEHVRVLGVVPIRTLRAIAAVFESRPSAGRFSALGTAEKLNFITEITAIPYRTIREYSDRPGELGLLMGKGLADSRRRGG